MHHNSPIPLVTSRSWKTHNPEINERSIQASPQPHLPKDNTTATIDLHDEKTNKLAHKSEPNECAVKDLHHPLPIRQSNQIHKHKYFTARTKSANRRQLLLPRRSLRTSKRMLPSTQIPQDAFEPNFAVQHAVSFEPPLFFSS